MKGHISFEKSEVLDMKPNVIAFVVIVFCLCLTFGAQAQNTTTSAQNCTPSQIKPTLSADLPPIPSWHPALKLAESAVSGSTEQNDG